MGKSIFLSHAAARRWATVVLVPLCEAPTRTTPLCQHASIFERKRKF